MDRFTEEITTMSHRSLSRRHFLHLSGALAAGGALAARAPLSALASPVEGQPITLTFWIPGGGGPFCAIFDTAGRNFTKLHPNIRLAKALCGTGQQDFITVLLARIAAGNPPNASIIWDTPVSLA